MTVCSLYGETIFREGGVTEKLQAAEEEVLRSDDNVQFLLHWEYDFGLQCLDAIAQACESCPDTEIDLVWIVTSGAMLEGALFQRQAVPPTVKWYQRERTRRQAARKWMIAESDVVIFYCYDRFFDAGAPIGLAAEEGTRSRSRVWVELAKAETYRRLKAQLYRLTPPQRAVHARRRAGWSPRQTARQMGLPLWRELLLEARGIWNLHLAGEAELRMIWRDQPHAPLFYMQCSYYRKKARHYFW